MVRDIHGQAILDYYNHDRQSKLFINNKYGEPEEMPLDVYFRTEDSFTEIEKTAISLCTGKILDIGAAAGDKVMALQKLGKDVSAIESSKRCVDVLNAQGISMVILEDYKVHDGKYDTLLLLMNGIGIAGTLNEIPEFLNSCKRLLNPGGQIILDSSDIKYLYEDNPDIEVPYPYYGDIQYQYEYKSHKGEWFDWVYADRDMLGQIVADADMNMEIITEDEFDQYLAKIW
jgi:SAM-dependent methyltransferase